jgi:hypothetical protein
MESSLLTTTTRKGKKKVTLSLCLTNSALRHEDVWGSGCIDPCFLVHLIKRVLDMEVHETNLRLNVFPSLLLLLLLNTSSIEQSLS